MAAALNTDEPRCLLEEDRFQRYEFAKRIAKMVTINTSQRSLVIGLYGKWGEGKTTVLNFVKQELTDNCVVINFNPWLFSDQEHLLKGFFKTIADDLKQSITKRKEELGKILSEYGDLIGSIKIQGLGLSGLSAFGNKLKDVSAEKLKYRIDTIIRDSKKKIVICIDDIDRLDVREIQYIFKLVKLVGDFSNTAYILAFDDEMVAGALAPLYGDGHKRNGHQFLEKIIQAPLVIPKATKSALNRYVTELIDGVFKELQLQLTMEDVNRFRISFDENFLPVIDNPRLAIRYANSLFFSMPLVIGEICTTDQMLVEGIKVLFPKAYDFMRTNSSLFLTDNARERSAFRPDTPDKSMIQAEIKKFLEVYSEKDAKRIMMIWRELFPQYAYISTNYGYTDDSWRDWYLAKRICSGSYFERYFTYSVNTGDISDVFFDQFLKELEYLSVDEARHKVTVLFEKTTPQEAIFKLRLWETRLNEKQSETLSELLAIDGNDFPVEPGELASYTSRSEGAKTIAQLIGNLNAKKRVQQAIKVFDLAKTLEYAMEISYWIFYKEEKRDEKLLTKANETTIHNYFLKRFKAELTISNFFTLVSDINLWRIMIWWKDKNAEELKSRLKQELSDNAEKAIQLIRIFAPTITSWGGKDGQQTYKGAFQESRYDAMTKLVDPYLVYQTLMAAGIYRLNNVNLKMIGDNERMSDEELANAFIQFYEKKHLRFGDLDN